MRNQVMLHYHSKEESYDKKCVWYWKDKEEGQVAYFTEYDDFGRTALFDYGGSHFLESVYFLICSQDWDYQTVDYKIERNSGVPITQIWLIEGDDTPYYSKQAAMTSPFYAQCDTQAFDMGINAKSFDKKWGFSDWLGFRHENEQTLFRLWAPTACKVSLILYDGVANDSPILKCYEMVRGTNSDYENHQLNTIGVWELVLDETLSDVAYSFQVEFPHLERTITRDPYAISVTEDGQRSVIYKSELLEIGDKNLEQHACKRWRLENSTEAIIYEMHVRDFSISKTSGISESLRGKFLGLSEMGTQNPLSDSTGFDYIKGLGITHIQLQPIFDHHKTYDNNGSLMYNWGYDPENYNAPETSFSTNPSQPKQAILELKSVIKSYHDAGIGVIMDVVYNHTYSTENSAFQLTVPDYYYRMNPDGSFKNGSGCGNETASEKEMFRKYMIDSICYWAREYDIDGFRFDLMGLHDVATMNLIREALDDIDPRIITYGEGWDMGDGLSPQEKAKKGNASLLPNIGFFNDDQRNAIKGAEVYGQFKLGYVSGKSNRDDMIKAIMGSQEFNCYLSPNQVVNYIEAHDNYNLNDLLWVLNSEDSNEQHIKRIELASALNLLMPGIAFMQIGQEFLRTKVVPTGDNGQVLEQDKQFAMNSYNAPDIVNQVDWNLVTYHKKTIAFIRNIIRLRKSEDLFSFSSFTMINDSVKVENPHDTGDMIVYSISKNKSYKIVFTVKGKRLHKNIHNDIIISNDRSLQKDVIEELSLLVIDITK